jgi:hypothetical protein
MRALNTIAEVDRAAPVYLCDLAVTGSFAHHLPMSHPEFSRL